MTQSEILKYLKKKPYISPDKLCRYLGIPVKLLAQVKAKERNLPEKYIDKISNELQPKHLKSKDKI